MIEIARQSARPDMSTVVREDVLKELAKPLECGDRGSGAFRHIDAVITDKKGHPPAHSDAPGHILVAYDIDARGVLTFAFMNADLARSAVKAGKLAGVLTDPDHSGIVDVTLTAPGAQLDAFLATPQGHAIFASTSPGIFRKGYAPTPETRD